MWEGQTARGSVDVTSVPATPLGALGAWEPSPAPIVATSFAKCIYQFKSLKKQKDCSTALSSGRKSPH